MEDDVSNNRDDDQNNDIVLRDKNVEVSLTSDDVQKLRSYEAECFRKIKKYHWYAIQCIGGREKKILAELKQHIINFENKDFENIFVCFKQSILKTTSGRQIKKMVNQFSGYFYIKMEMTKEAYQIVRQTANIIGFLGMIKGKADNHPQVIADKEVEKQIARFSQKPKRLQKEVVVKFKVGDFVEVTGGAFEGYMAKVLAIGKDSVKIAIDLLGHEVESKVSIDDVKEI